MMEKKNISCYMNLRDVDLSKAPDVSFLIEGYEMSASDVEVESQEALATWSVQAIEELKLSDKLNDEAFLDYFIGISRERFVYLMVELYEDITGEKAIIDENISFSDTDDINALKAASLEITNGIGDGKFGPSQTINREQMTTFVIRTLNAAGIELVAGEPLDLFEDDALISEWAKESIYTSKTNCIINGTGKGLFNPEGIATTEQALVVTHRLLSKYGDLKWFEEVDGSRVYLKNNDKLYKIGFDGNILINKGRLEKDLFMMNFDDYEKFLNISQIKTSPQFDKDANPNFEGTLKVTDYNVMTMDVSNLYSGVDKIGEKTRIDIGTTSKKKTS